MNSADDFAQGIEIVPGRWSFVWVKRPDSVRTSQIAAANICYCIDDELLYEPFFADFGPLNLGRTYRFCKKTQELLQEAERSKKKLFLWTGPSAHHKANAAVLVGIFQVLYLQRSAEDALKPLLAMKPYVPFRDASCGVSTFHLTVMDCIKGIQKARDVGFIDWNSGSSTWSVDEYEHFEQVENGDLNWIVPGKLVAFSGPAARGNEIVGYRLLTPEDYWDYYRRKGVTTIVRLNKKVYDRRRFTDGGFKHVDLYFPDGSCPTDAILHRFLDIAENEPGALAVHCKAGLGRTGVLICCYIMKHYRFTAEEVIGYIRVCRPGSVIGPQQNFIREMEARMWHEGEIYRQQKGLAPKAALLSQDLTVNGKVAPSVDPVDSPYVAKVHAAVNGHYANGHASGYGHVPAAHVPLTRHNSGGQQLRPQELMIGNASSQQGPAAQAHTPASDLSLVQYKMQYGMPVSGPANGSVSASAASSNGMYGMANMSPSGSPTGAGAVSQALGNGVGSSRTRYSHRSITPLRYGISSPSSGAAANGYSGSSNGLSSAYGVSASYPSSPTGASRQSILSSAVPGASVASAVSRSMPVMPARSPSADRASARLNSTGGSGASLRATLHTDTVQAADRPKVLPERNMQSADASSSGWRLSASPSSPALGATPAGARSSSTGRAVGNGTGIARVLAPNGQPRKVPVSMLHQYSAPAPLSAMAHQGLLPSGRPSSIAIGASDAGRMKAAGVQQLRYALHSK